MSFGEWLSAGVIVYALCAYFYSRKLIKDLDKSWDES